MYRNFNPIKPTIAMGKIKEMSVSIAGDKFFDIFITIIILVNSLLIGVQTTHSNHTIELIQRVILYIFTFEIAIRYIAAKDNRSIFSEGWNIFDLSLVLIGWIPESMFESASTLMALRVLRVFRVLRLLRTAKEIKVIVAVLLKSMKSMLYNCLLFMIFVYLYAVAGVSMFRLPDPATLQGEELQRYEQLMTQAPNTPVNSPDPFGSIGEGIFTLFRALTGEDWTDLRYNLVTASELGIVNISPTIITGFFVSWFCISAFLLLNLVTGAVINNYQLAMEEVARRKRKSQAVADNDGEDVGSTEPDTGTDAPVMAANE